MLSALPREEENGSRPIGFDSSLCDGLTDENVVVLGRPQDRCRVLLIVDDRRHPDGLFPAARKGEGDIRQVQLSGPDNSAARAERDSARASAVRADNMST